jgi:hypothetical protein
MEVDASNSKLNGHKSSEKSLFNILAGKLIPLRNQFQGNAKSARKQLQQQAAMQGIL